MLPPRDRDLLIFTRSCSELFGVAGSNSVVTSCFPYSYLLAATRSCSEQKCPSNQSHSKCTNGTVYKVKTSKLGNIVKPGQRLEKNLLTSIKNAFFIDCFWIKVITATIMYCVVRLFKENYFSQISHCD